MAALDYSKIPEADVVVDYVRQRYERGLYSLVLVTGLPGSGKSSTCVRLGQIIEKDLFGEIRLTEDCIVDSLLSFLTILKRVTVPGKVIIIEELSVLFPSRRAMSGDNVAIARVLDTCRKKGVILLSNAPLLPSIDGHIRALANILIETLKINRTEQVVVSKAFRLQTNPRNSKTYLHRFNRDGKEVHRIITHRPIGNIWELYEANKDKFIDELYTDLHMKAQGKKEKDRAQYANPTGLTTLQLTKILPILERNKTQGIRSKQIDIAKELKLEPRTLCVAIASMRKKGYLIDKNGNLY